MNISFSSKSVHLSYIRPKTDPLLQQKLPHNEVESKACDAAQQFWEFTPILNREQPEAVEDSDVELNDPESVARAHPTTALSY